MLSLAAALIGRYLQTYAETKAMGEKAMTDACSDDFMTCAVAPHQVYGPRDNLFLPNLLEACGTNRLRVFGKVPALHCAALLPLLETRARTRRTAAVAPQSLRLAPAPRPVRCLPPCCSLAAVSSA